jgi:hypothetical protein
MALMASDQPTLGGALGEAGMVGVEGFRSARDTYENVRMNLMQAINAQKAAAAKALGGGGGGSSGGGSGTPSLKDFISGAKGYGELLDLVAPDDGMGGRIVPEEGTDARRTYDKILAEQNRYINGALPADLDLTQ